MWAIFALFSAFFAALTSIFAKIGIDGVNSNLATAIRTFVVLLLAWFIVYITGVSRQIPDITRKSWIFLILSGLTTGASWLFYYKALQAGSASKVVPVDKFSLVFTVIMAYFILGEALTIKVVLGGILITAGTLLMIL
ncbi:MAG: EamA family transporter [Elusimicrobia bacterium]|nr:EamA family transporter [Elusimicrobiota bacterium]